jgi:hypothetical protein
VSQLIKEIILTELKVLVDYTKGLKKVNKKEGNKPVFLYIRIKVEYANSIDSPDFNEEGCG